MSVHSDFEPNVDNFCRLTDKNYADMVRGCQWLGQRRCFNEQSYIFALCQARDTDADFVYYNTWTNTFIYISCSRLNLSIHVAKSTVSV